MLMVLFLTNLQVRLYPSIIFSPSMFSKVFMKSLLGHIQNEQPESSNQKIDFLQQQGHLHHLIFIHLLRQQQHFH